MQWDTLRQGRWEVAMSRELDAEIATKIMGWKLVDIPFVPNKIDGRTAIFTDAAALEWRKTYPNGCSVNTVPKFLTCFNACAEAEIKMGELGLGEMYIRELCAYLKVWKQKFTNPGIKNVFKMVTAPPHIRCLAMLEAKKASDD